MVSPAPYRDCSSAMAGGGTTGKVAVRGVCSGECTLDESLPREARMLLEKWKRRSMSPACGLPRGSFRCCGGVGGGPGVYRRGVRGSDSPYALLGPRSGEPMGGEMGRLRIEALRFLPKDPREAKDDREELREGELLMLIGDGLAMRRGDAVVCREEGA